MMHERERNRLPRIPGRRAPLAAAVVGLFGLTTQAAHAAFATYYVTNCDDAGAGSLRDAVSLVSDGDTVDYSGLSNCIISITTGQIVAPFPNLKLRGNVEVPIDGTHNTSGNTLLINTAGGGVVYLNHVTLRHNMNQSTQAVGGCIATAGALTIYNSSLDDCAAHSTNGLAAGGAIAATGYVYLSHVKISNSEANPSAGAPAVGGAVATQQWFSSTYSTISGNAVDRNNVGKGVGGAVYASGGVHLTRSVIASNHASDRAGGVFAFDGPQVIVQESTISGNDAATVSGLYVVNVPDVWIDNSTIAFNTGTTLGQVAPGVTIFGGDQAQTTIKMHSSIISNNYEGAYTVDFFASSSKAISFDPSSSNNLVRSAFGLALPADTNNGCPLLAPLRDNGGFTMTHALGSGSPAINAGSNPYSDVADQRFSDGISYFFPRESPVGAPDIGAYEVDKSNILFSAGFDGCEPPPS